MLQAKTADMQHGKDIEPLLRSYFTSAEINNWWNKLERDINKGATKWTACVGPFKILGRTAARK